MDVTVLLHNIRALKCLGDDSDPVGQLDEAVAIAQTNDFVCGTVHNLGTPLGVRGGGFLGDRPLVCLDFGGVGWMVPSPSLLPFSVLGNNRIGESHLIHSTQPGIPGKGIS